MDEGFYGYWRRDFEVVCFIAGLERYEALVASLDTYTKHGGVEEVPVVRGRFR